MQITLNLATRRYYNQPRLRALLLIVAAVLLLLTGIGVSQLIGYRAEAARLTDEITSFEQRLAGHPSGVAENAFDLHRQQLAALHEILTQRQRSARVLLDALEAALPGGVAYTQIVPETKDNLVKLEGRARSLAILSDLLERLGSADGFRHPTLLTTEDTAPQGQPGAPAGLRFVITVTWVGP